MYKKLRHILILAIAIMGYFPVSAFAQDLPPKESYGPGKKDSLSSVILKEKRFIQVMLPEKYKPGSADKYDVLYVLDDWNFKLAQDMQRYLENEGFMPSSIIVGVFNTDRDRDLTPTHVENTKTSGGAAQFLDFLKNELIPYVNKNYPSNGDNTLFGHSYGGLFVMYALLNQPQLFKSYIAGDPSFWWDKKSLNKQAVDKLPALANTNKTLYITGREGEGMIGMGIPPMDTILKKYAPADLKWKIMAYPEETHGSVRLKSMYDGLKFSYLGYSTKGPEFHPMAGILLKDKPIKIRNFGSLENIRYTNDGTEPTATSPKMGAGFTLTGPAVVTAKSFSNRDRNNKTRTGVFTEGTFLPNKSSAKNFQPGGFHFAYYEGEWDKLPDFKKLTPIQTGIADKNFDLNKLPRQNNFALLFEGMIEIKEDGYYALAILSDDGSRFYINDKLVLDNDGLHSSEDYKSYIAPLKKGFYPIKLEYFQKDGGRDLRFIYLSPATIDTFNAAPFPLELQWGRK